MTAPLCFVDTETTGVHPGRRAWEIALIRRDETGTQEVSFFVDVNLAKADPFGLKVGRFHERHPRGQYLAGLVEGTRTVGEYGETNFLGDGYDLVFEWSAAEVVARMTHGAHLVGAVPNFDAEVFDRLLRRHRIIPAWYHHLIDVEALAVGYLAGLNASSPDDDVLEDLGIPVQAYGDLDSAALPWKSDELSRVCGVEPPTEEERHTALGDARWAMRWYDAIVGATE